MLETFRDTEIIRTIEPELELLLYMPMFIVILQTWPEVVLITCKATSSSVPTLYLGCCVIALLDMSPQFLKLCPQLLRLRSCVARVCRRRQLRQSSLCLVWQAIDA